MRYGSDGLSDSPILDAADHGPFGPDEVVHQPASAVEMTGLECLGKAAQLAAYGAREWLERQQLQWGAGS